MRYEKQLMELGVLSQEDVDRLEAEVIAEINTTIEEVETMAMPSPYEDFMASAIDGL